MYVCTTSNFLSLNPVGCECTIPDRIMDMHMYGVCVGTRYTHALCVISVVIYV